MRSLCFWCIARDLLTAQAAIRLHSNRSPPAAFIGGASGDKSPKRQLSWCIARDLNPQPLGSKPSALSNCASDASAFLWNEYEPLCVCMRFKASYSIQLSYGCNHKYYIKNNPKLQDIFTVYYTVLQITAILQFAAKNWHTITNYFDSRSRLSFIIDLAITVNSNNNADSPIMK